MDKKTLLDKHDSLSTLNNDLLLTTKKSCALIDSFINDQNKSTLDQAWIAVELIISVLEDIQSELVKTKL